MVLAHLPLIIPYCERSAVTIKTWSKATTDESELRVRSDARLEPRPVFEVGAVSVYLHQVTNKTLRMRLSKHHLVPSGMSHNAQFG